ncbi:hypothetical protein [Luteolibacter marinus]|uniref:hypothetical protein n=1 Tax=Luteolibacter marinus TaxID=2776705 RepID=UPI001866E9EB|nr:hypothetical protein [Luteolibacter marinus]
MNRALAILCFAALVGCGDNHKTMSSGNLPEGWTAGDAVPHDQIYSDPPDSPAATRIQFYGLMEGDPGHRLYSIPADTPIAEVVKAFEVGSHGSMSYGYESGATVNLVADKATKISEIIPCRITFADPAGLKLRFSRQVTEDHLKQIEALFPEEEVMQAGLERYLSEWDGESSILAPVLQENLFHFWWD